MIRFGRRQRPLDDVEREAGAWIRKLSSGRVTDAEAQAFLQWREQHAAAYARAMEVWRHMGTAGEQVRRRQAVAAYPANRLARRAFIGAALAGGAALATVAAIAPPLGWWPALWDPQADFHTATGEQRELDLQKVLVAMNTQTRIALRPDIQDARTIELLGGEAAIEMSRTDRAFVVIAGHGMTRSGSKEARFEVRQDGTRTCVTCLAGWVQVEQGGRRRRLEGNQQLRYNATLMSEVVTVDASITSAWRQGMLVFQQTPLSLVIAEFNRYRPGRVVLADDSKGNLPLNGRFHIDRLDEGLLQIAQALHLKQRSMAGIVLLG